jgi:hypothetical protein
MTPSSTSIREVSSISRNNTTLWLLVMLDSSGIYSYPNVA